MKKKIIISIIALLLITLITIICIKLYNSYKCNSTNGNNCLDPTPCTQAFECNKINDEFSECNYCGEDNCIRITCKN